MPTKTTKKISVKKEFSSTKIDWEKKVNYAKVEKKDSVKKGVVRRRKVDLTPTRASAVAIASQAAKKQALIDRVASNNNVINKCNDSSKIPTWVWTFFWCSLLLFCVSFYQAIIRPQLETELTEANIDRTTYEAVWNNIVSLWWIQQNNVESDIPEDNPDLKFEVSVPVSASDTIEEFFARLSNHYYDEAFNLFTPSLQRSSEIREHFTSFRMNPFISGIQWELKPDNLEYISTSNYWKDRYGFDLSYTLADTQEQFDESWEFVVDTSGEEPKIASIICVTNKCSRHPIFWPESYGLMR